MSPILERLKRCNTRIYDSGVGGPDLIEDAIAALAAQQDGAWQPIETAPKDGSEIMLDVDGVARFGFWFTPDPIFVDPNDAKAKQRGIYPRWAYWPTTGGGEFHFHGWCEPKQWRLVPVPPQS